jgi:hypothetical protein
VRFFAKKELIFFRRQKQVSQTRVPKGGAGDWLALLEEADKSFRKSRYLLFSHRFFFLGEGAQEPPRRISRSFFFSLKKWVEESNSEIEKIFSRT